MRMHKKIRKYFADGCPFAVGVSLYLSVGGTYAFSYFQNYLSAAWVPEAVDMSLRGALIEWLEANIEADADNTEEEETEEKTANVFEPKKDEPEEITEIRIRAKIGHKQHSDAKGKLNGMAAEFADRYADAERLEVVQQIMRTIVPDLDVKYDGIREWEKTGELPTKNVNSVVFETVKKMQRVTSLRSAVSRLPKLIAQSTDAAMKKKREGALREKEAELQSLCIELGIT